MNKHIKTLYIVILISILANIIFMNSVHKWRTNTIPPGLWFRLACLEYKGEYNLKPTDYPKERVCVLDGKEIFSQGLDANEITLIPTTVE